MVFTKRFVFIILLTIFGIQEIQAEETDQFTLPPYELIDIGPTASQQLFAVIEAVVARTNSEIQLLLPRVEHSKHAASQLELRHSGSYIADLVYQKTGPGYPRWLRLSKERNRIFYKESRPWKTVYWLSFSQSPLSIIGLAPTINMFGYYFGTDKLGHFFMQGHTYFKIYTYLLKHGKSPEQAHSIIVSYGQVLEQTYLGTLVNGIYSNADLSSNYSGWKFYLNLTQSIKIADKTIPPILILKNNQWEIARHINPATLLKPYLTDNLSEALNPCRYSFMRSQIRRQIKKRCSAWIERRGITQQNMEAKLEETSRWHGEQYGHWLPEKNAVTLKTCFGGR